MTTLDDIGRVVRKISQDDERILSVYLFGSRAGGSEREGSDVDLGVLFASPQGLAEVVRLEIRFEEALGEKVDLVNVGSCEAFLALDVIRGERLFARDIARCDEFDLYVMRRAGDLAPFERERRRMLLYRDASPAERA